MNRILKTIIFTCLIISACNLQFVPDSQPLPNTPAPTAGSTETVAPSATLTETAQPASATPEFAPMCTANYATASPAPQCQLPSATDSSAFCSEKDPYNLIFVSKGSTFKSLTTGFTCRDAGIKNDKQMVTCTGQMAAEYQVSICNPTCVVPTVQAAITQCPQDYNYNAVLGCCTQEIQQLQQSCVVLELKTTTCVVDCRQYSKKKTCDKNSNACVWDEQNEVCQLRR
jgi:hypothetical protein